MINLFWALGASIVVSLISLIGILSLLFKDTWLNRALVLLIGFAAGGFQELLNFQRRQIFFFLR